MAGIPAGIKSKDDPFALADDQQPDDADDCHDNRRRLRDAAHAGHAASA
jgi:hypothetical protein